MTEPPPPTERRFVRTRQGTIHVASCGQGLPVLLLHQTPRSWDEYRDVLPLLGRHVHAIAMDTLGYGDSDRIPPGEASIERWADGAAALLDALGVDRFALVGHHTGSVIAVELAARFPGRVAALVLSSCPLVDAARRARGGAHGVDQVDRHVDGRHLGQFWAGRAAFYPQETDLLERYVVDALKAGTMASGGHAVVNRYHMEDRLPLIACPTLVIRAADDPHAFPHGAPLAAAIPGAGLVTIEGGTVPLPDHMPAAFAAAVLHFLQSSGALAA